MGNPPKRRAFNIKPRKVGVEETGPPKPRERIKSNYMTVPDAAKRLGVAKEEIERWLQEGAIRKEYLPSIHVPLFNNALIESILAEAKGGTPAIEHARAAQKKMNQTVKISADAASGIEALKQKMRERAKRKKG